MRLGIHSFRGELQGETDVFLNKPYISAIAEMDHGAVMGNPMVRQSRTFNSLWHRRYLCLGNRTRITQDNPQAFIGNHIFSF